MATINSAADGNWSVGATWSGGVIPAAGDTINITHNVIMDLTNHTGPEFGRINVNRYGTLRHKTDSDTCLCCKMMLYIYQGLYQCCPDPGYTATVRFRSKSYLGSSEGDVVGIYGAAASTYTKIEMRGQSGLPEISCSYLQPPRYNDVLWAFDAGPDTSQFAPGDYIALYFDADQYFTATGKYGWGGPFQNDVGYIVHTVFPSQLVVMPRIYAIDYASTLPTDIAGQLKLSVVNYAKAMNIGDMVIFGEMGEADMGGFITQIDNDSSVVYVQPFDGDDTRVYEEAVMFFGRPPEPTHKSTVESVYGIGTTNIAVHTAQFYGALEQVRICNSPTDYDERTISSVTLSGTNYYITVPAIARAISYESYILVNNAVKGYDSLLHERHKAYYKIRKIATTISSSTANINIPVAGDANPSATTTVVTLASVSGLAVNDTLIIEGNPEIGTAVEYGIRGSFNFDSAYRFYEGKITDITGNVVTMTPLVSHPVAAKTYVASGGYVVTKTNRNVRVLPMETNPPVTYTTTGTELVANSTKYADCVYSLLGTDTIGGVAVSAIPRGTFINITTFTAANAKYNGIYVTEGYQATETSRTRIYRHKDASRSMFYFDTTSSSNESYKKLVVRDVEFRNIGSNSTTIYKGVFPRGIFQRETQLCFFSGNVMANGLRWSSDRASGPLVYSLYYAAVRNCVSFDMYNGLQMYDTSYTGCFNNITMGTCSGSRFDAIYTRCKYQYNINLNSLDYCMSIGSWYSGDNPIKQNINKHSYAFIYIGGIGYGAKAGIIRENSFLNNGRRFLYCEGGRAILVDNKYGFNTATNNANKLTIGGGVFSNTNLGRSLEASSVLLGINNNPDDWEISTGGGVIMRDPVKHMGNGWSLGFILMNSSYETRISQGLYLKQGEHIDIECWMYRWTNYTGTRPPSIVLWGYGDQPMRREYMPVVSDRWVKVKASWDIPITAMYEIGIGALAGNSTITERSFNLDPRVMVRVKSKDKMPGMRAINMQFDIGQIMSSTNQPSVYLGNGVQIGN